MHKAAIRKTAALPPCHVQGMVSALLSAFLFDTWANLMEKEPSSSAN